LAAQVADRRTGHSDNARRPRASLPADQRRNLDRLATVLRAQGHPHWEIAAEIADLAGITRLWAWRMATGWSRAELLERLHRSGRADNAGLTRPDPIEPPP